MITLGPRTWWEVSEEINTRIENAVRAGRVEEAFKWLNVMDLLDTENAAYWRETGWEAYTGGPTKISRQPGIDLLD